MALVIGYDWLYHFLSEESRNILMFNGHHHNVKGLAEIVETFDTPRRKGAVVDSSTAFCIITRESKKCRYTN